LVLDLVVTCGRDTAVVDAEVRAAVLRSLAALTIDAGLAITAAAVPIRLISVEHLIGTVGCAHAVGAQTTGAVASGLAGFIVSAALSRGTNPTAVRGRLVLVENPV
jgi:hypothetical protein